MRTSIGFALGTLLSLGIAMSASAEGATVATPAKVAARADVEVIVVTAKRPAAEAIEEIIVTAKRPTPSTATAPRTPPAMAIELPKLEFELADRPVFRL